jgi:hypothetical protein
LEKYILKDLGASQVFTYFSNRHSFAFACLGKNQDPLSRITRSKKAGGLAPVVKQHPSKCKIMSSNPRIVHIQKKKKEFRDSFICD